MCAIRNDLARTKNPRLVAVWLLDRSDARFVARFGNFFPTRQQWLQGNFHLAMESSLQAQYGVQTTQQQTSECSCKKSKDP